MVNFSQNIPTPAQQMQQLTIEVCSPLPIAQAGGSLITSSRQSIGAVTRRV
jgi:hypothetical protein